MGTRPEIIKMAPVIKEYVSRDLSHVVLHTGQHYSPQLDKVFFDDLQLPPPHVRLKPDEPGTCQGERLGKIYKGMVDLYGTTPIANVLVQGDTDSALGAAMAGTHLGAVVAHVEAGLRSYQRELPEEHNRVTIDHLSDILFAPTRYARDNLTREGIHLSDIHLVGNTVADSLYMTKHLWNDQRLVRAPYILVTIHRQENVDNPEKLTIIMNELRALSTRMAVYFPMHPRTKLKLHGRDYGVNPSFYIMEPMGYLDFMGALQGADLVITDSGGIQEEACILGVPCVTVRDSTERPETIVLRSNVLAPVQPGAINYIAQGQMRSDRIWEHPYGQGTAASHIVDHMEAYQ